MKGREDITRKFRKFDGLYQAIENLQPDILFIHGVAFCDIDTVVSYIKEHDGITVYADNHADFSNSATNWISKNILHKLIWKRYAHKLLPFVKKFYGVTPGREVFLHEIYGIPRDRISLLVMGVDDEMAARALLPETQSTIRNKLKLSMKDFIIMTGGKIDLAKQQVVTLMKAVNSLKIENVKLIVFGSVVNELEKKIKEECGKYCQYIGWVTAEETLNYFGCANLVVFPGRHSVFWEQVVGLGKPMICKYWEGTTHIDLGGNVKFFYNDTKEEMANTILESIDKDTYDKMVGIAVKKGKEKFSYRNIALHSLELL